MHQAFLDVNGVRTSVLTYGKWVEESGKSPEPENIILIIPGNPGVTAFYRMFMHTLHEKTGYPVWIVGHAGHEIPINNTVYPIPSLKGNEELFGLQGQIDHKVDFIKKYVPENAKIHLVGHSIGAYIILNLLKNESIKEKLASVQSINLLFPALEHMDVSPNGKFLATFIKPIVWLIVFLSMIYTILPSVLQNFFMFVYMRVVGMPKMHFKTLVRFIHPSVLKKVFFMAFKELDQVRERDDAIIKQNLDKLRILYGQSDGWAPPSYCYKLKTEIPGIHAEICRFNHAFVLKHSREVGNVVADWILAR